MQIQFRQTANNDFSAIAQLVSNKEELLLISPKSQFPWTDEQVKAIAETRQFNTVAINENGDIIGYANVYNAIANQSAFIGNVIVDRAVRGQSIGEKLMQHMIGICQSQLNAVAQVSVFNHNTNGLRFYHRLGFVPFAIEQREYENNKMMLIHLKLLK